MSEILLQQPLYELTKDGKEAYDRIVLGIEEWEKKTKKWDQRFLDLAFLVASWSKDPSTKVGAVIVRPDRTVASLGYNGFPRGCSDAKEIYEDRPKKYSRVVHAETNAILSPRERLDGYTLYITHTSCDRCATNVIQSGITRVVFGEEPDASRWKEATDSALEMYEEAGVLVSIHNETK